MTVKEVVLLAATELGIADDVQAYIESESGAGERETKLLVECFNIVENELALDYLPLYAEEELCTETGAILFSQLGDSAVRILRVEDEWGNGLKFSLFPVYLKTQPGKVKVTYTYTPKRKELNGSSDFVLQASPRLLAHGIAAEYSLATGRFEEAAIWDKKYKDGIQAAYKAAPCKKMRSRRWA